jgi:hypothetical protein
VSTADIAPTAWPLLLGDRGVTAGGPAVVSTDTPRPRADWPARAERLLAFLLPLAGYLWVGVQLSLVYHSYIGDALSREANAYYVFFSNDPHLAAIGFVWNPLTSISEMPLILLKGWWPALTAAGFAASIMSAVFMAGACYQLIRFMTELGVGRVIRWLLLACFALNPMIVFSGGNGMSEALFIFTLLAATRRLSGWLVRGGTRDLVVSGVWLALAYAARNEAAMAALLASVVVVVVSYSRSSGTAHQRRLSAVTDGVIVAAPFALSFIGWAATSWIIVGHPFEQFSSVYGTSSQLKLIEKAQHGRAAMYSVHGALAAILAFAPLLPVVGAVAIVRSIRDREPRILAVLAVMGGVVFFEIVAFTFGMINLAERYFIYAIPLIVLLAAIVARPAPKTDAEVREERIEQDTGVRPRYLATRRLQRRLLSAIAGVAAVVALIPGMFTIYHEMFYTLIGQSDAEQLSWILMPGTPVAQPYEVFRNQYKGLAAEAAWLDGLHAGKGGIMMDDAVGCIPQVILASRHPSEFTIPNDVNYTELFGAPYQDGIRYLLVSDPHSEYGSLDSLDRQWPTLYDTGDGLGTRIQQVQIPGCTTTYRVYKLFAVKNS